jgi:hypothetical protein
MRQLLVRKDGLGGTVHLMAFARDDPAHTH